MTANIICAGCTHTYADSALFCPNCGRPKVRDVVGDVLLGKVLGERFQVQELLGQGASGTIYRAEHVTLRRKVAIKVLHNELSRDDLAVERFRREATTVAEIDNEHIVEIHDFGRTPDGRLYLAMELLDGETLDGVLAREQQLSVERAADILIQVGEALMEAHAIGYVHRDLRPRNVYLANRRGKANFVKLLDFGLAKLVETDASAASTSLGMTFGDPRYMSPEQARGDRIDRRADIYQLGCVAYEMLTGAPPFSGNRVFDILTKQVTEVPQPLPTRRPGVPLWMEAAVTKMLAKDPENRFATTTRMVEALRRGLETGEVMEDEIARRRESIPPPSVSRVMQRMGLAQPADAPAREPAGAPAPAAEQPKYQGNQTVRGHLPPDLLSPQGQVPPVGASRPAVGASGPAVGVSGPAVGVSGPAVGVSGPAVGVSGPAVGTSGPAVGTAGVSGPTGTAGAVSGPTAGVVGASGPTGTTAAPAAGFGVAGSGPTVSSGAASNPTVGADAAVSGPTAGLGAAGSGPTMSSAGASPATGHAATSSPASGSAAGPAFQGNLTVRGHSLSEAGDGSPSGTHQGIVAPAKADSVELLRRRTGTPRLGVPVPATAAPATVAPATAAPVAVIPPVPVAVSSGPPAMPDDPLLAPVAGVIDRPEPEARTSSSTPIDKRASAPAEPNISQVWYEDGDDPGTSRVERNRRSRSSSTTDLSLYDEVPRRRRWGLILAALAVVLVGGGALALTLGVGKSSEQPSVATQPAASPTAMVDAAPSTIISSESPDAAPAAVAIVEPSAGSGAGKPVKANDRKANPEPPKVAPPKKTPGNSGGDSSAFVPPGGDDPGFRRPGGSSVSTTPEPKTHSTAEPVKKEPASASVGVSGAGGPVDPYGAGDTPPSDPGTSAGAAPEKQAEFFANLGSQQLANGDAATAAANFKKALEIDSKSAPATIGMGEIALRQGLFGDAIAHLRKAARLVPKSGRVFTLLGEAYLALGQNSDAASNFKKALQIDPDNARAREGYDEASSRVPAPSDE